MKLFYANMTRSYVPFSNFGDDLNPWVWKKLIFEILEDKYSQKTTFVGFGTLLNEKLPKFNRTVIFGTGVGYGSLPKINDSWKIYCVRGPLSAKELNLPLSLGIADTAIMVNRVYAKKDFRKEHKISVIPYAWEMQINSEVFISACNRLGFNCIDPRNHPEKVLDEIYKSELVLTAAMHGAIVADALRVPWISFKSNGGIPDFKWMDFCASMNLDYDSERLFRFSSFSKMLPFYSHLESRIVENFLRSLVKKKKPQLSEEKTLSARLDALEDKLETFKKDFKAGKFND